MHRARGAKLAIGAALSAALVASGCAHSGQGAAPTTVSTTAARVAAAHATSVPPPPATFAGP
ncbi:MAG TPA: hypothetical protein VEJ84_02340, partial [Acidimicrobiales bacterium]|nr:hypothetical protein [Acidimicrobiales bacterium]